MVLEKAIVGKEVLVDNETFDVDKIYKAVKEKAEDLGYFFIEKEQATRPTKYGNELKFKFSLSKEVDDFGRKDFDINLDFSNLNKVKNLDRGNCKVMIKGNVVYDYKTHWGKTKFGKFLLEFYVKVMEAEMKKKYIIPLIKDGSEFHVVIKEKFGLYNS